MKVSIIIPVFNEERELARVLDGVIGADTSPFEKEIVTVNDGSTDRTEILLADYARSHRDLRIIHHQVNRGKASAIRSALAAATGDIVLIQDADTEYSPADYPTLLQPFLDEATKVVYGSRFLSTSWPAHMKPANWIANKVFTGLINLLYGAHITDEGTAYKLFRAPLLRSIPLRCDGFNFCPEVTAKLLKQGVPIVEVPVAYAARSRKEGKKPGYRDGLQVLWTIVKQRFR